MKYRNELKFEVSEAELVKIKHRLMPLMKLDSHQEENGYMIRSLYFDDIYNTYAYENDAGIGTRKKYRIRIYNASSSVIHLEKKSKDRGMTKKCMQSLSKSQCEAIINNNWAQLRENNEIQPGSLLEEVYIEVIRKKLFPKCIVEYDRYAFVEQLGNVRVTFDRNVSGSNNALDFFEEKIPLTPILPEGRHILEVKFDELLPQYILQAIDMGTLRKQSFSKYCAARAVLQN